MNKPEGWYDNHAYGDENGGQQTNVVMNHGNISAEHYGGNLMYNSLLLFCWVFGPWVFL